MWDLLFKTPILNLLFLFYRVFFYNFGLAVIALTVFIQLLLIPLRLPSLRSAKKMQDLKPELDGIRDKHKGDQKTFARAQMELYQKHGVNPLTGCLPTLLAVPFMIALYQVLIQVLNLTDLGQLNQQLYFEFLKLSQTHIFNPRFFWLNLTRSDPIFLLPLLVGFSQWYLSRSMQGSRVSKPVKKPEEKDKEKKESMEEMMEAMQGQMQFMFPLMSVVITLSLPSGVSLYWLVSTLFAIIQQKIFTK